MIAGRNRVGATLFALLVVTSGLVAFVAPVAAATLTVDDSGGAEYTTIQAAVDAASPGDTIQVSPGTYDETVTIDKPNLTLRGDPGDSARGPGANAPVVAPGSNNNYNFVLTEKADGTVIEGFEFDGTDDGAIYLDVSSGTLEGVTIRDNDIAGNDDGIDGSDISGNLMDLTITRNRFTSLEGIDFNLNAAKLSFENVAITDNSFEGEHEQIEFDKDFGGVRIVNVTISGNDITSTFGDGINIDSGGAEAVYEGITITGNTISAPNEEGMDIDLESEYDGAGTGGINDLTISNNNIQSIDEAVELDLDPEGNPLSNVQITGNTLTSTTDEGIDFDIDSDNATSVSTPNTVSDIAIEDNTIRAEDDDGIIFDIDAYDTDVSRVSLSGNTITDVDSEGIDAEFDGENSSFESISLDDNTVTDVGFIGIDVDFEADDSSFDSISLNGNNVTTTEDEGIGIGIYDIEAAHNVVVVGNNINNAGDDGIDVAMGSIEGADLVELEIRNNVVNNSSEDGLEFTVSNIGQIEATITRNAFTHNGESGLRFDEDVPVANVTVSENNIAGNAEFGIWNQNLTHVLDARNNWWGNETGPSSLGGLLADPVETTVLANGTGDGVSPGLTGDDLSNVRFAPFALTPFDISLELEPELPVSSVGVPHAIFEITAHSVTPRPATVGEPVEISYTVENVGAGNGFFAGFVTADGERIFREGADLAPGESRTFNFTHVFEEADGYDLLVRHDYLTRLVVEEKTLPLGDPANLTVRHAHLTRGTVAPGEHYDLVAVVENSGGTARYELPVAETFDNATDTTTHLRTFEAGETRTLRFDLTAPDVEGTVGYSLLGTPVGTVTVTADGAGAGVGHSYTPDCGEDGSYTIVSVLNNPGETPGFFVVRYVPLDANGTAVGISDVELFERGLIRLVILEPGETIELPFEVTGADGAQGFSVNGVAVAPPSCTVPDSSSSLPDSTPPQAEG